MSNSMDLIMFLYANEIEILDITISNRYLCMMIEIKFDIDPDSS